MTAAPRHHANATLATTVQLTPFTRARWGVELSALLAIGSISRYPGGSRANHTAAGYSFSHNFLSDLGMTVAYGGQRNLLGAVLFTASLTIIVIGLGVSLIGFVRLYSTARAARHLARAAAAVGFIVCAAFIGVALTPENWALDLHVSFTLFAFRIFPFMPLLLAFASLFSIGVPRRVVAGWAALTAVLAGYVVLIGWGPPIDTPLGLSVQVSAQKLVVLSSMMIFVYLSIEADRILAGPRLESVRGSTATSATVT